ncbi:MAG: site-specific integrase [Bacteroidota bacterium]
MEVCKTNSIALTLETIDKKTGERIEEGYIKANYASGTINTHIKNLKVFLKWASENGFNVPVSGLAIKKPKAERATIQFLNEDELAKVENAVLPPSLDRHRDLFLFTCYTGLRYSDLANLKPENYKNSQLKITTIKTHHEIFIPIHPRAKDIIEKYGGKLPHPVSNQKMNDALKKIGFAAGLTDMEQIVSYKGGKRIQESLPKHELLTCHVGRRTFIIYSLQRGVRPETLMEATGHRDIRILMQYVKITPDVLAKELFTAWGQPEVQIRKIG